jgi:hypothetical protein
MTVAAEESAPLLRYPLHRQEDYGATIEFVVQRIKAEYDEEDAILKAPSIGYSVTPRDKPTAPAAPAAPAAPVVGVSEFYEQRAIASRAVYDDAVAPSTSAPVVTDNTPVGNGESIPKFNDRTKQLRQSKEPDEKTRISLYLPAGLAFSDGVSYENTDIGIFGVAAEKAMAQGQGAASAVKSIFDGVAQLKGTPAGRAQVAKLFQTALAATIPGEGVSAGVSGTLRVRANPHTRILFGSVTPRTFEFAFTFLPASLKEAEAVHNIIKIFRTEVYPEGIAKIDNTYFGYKYPDTFGIRFMYGGKEIQDAPKLLDCYLQTVNTNYNPTEMAFHKLQTVNEEEEDAGKIKFTEITMTLSFAEERTLFKQDILDLYSRGTSIGYNVTPRDKPTAPARGGI